VRTQEKGELHYLLKLMKITYDIGKKHHYSTLVVGMVQGFYDALISRGANPIDNEIVQIVGRTNLNK
jgi:hypothetical protein